MKFLKKLFNIRKTKQEKNNTFTPIVQETTYEDELLERYGNCLPAQKLGIKILTIADTHNCLSYNENDIATLKNITDYDICILIGDHSARDLDTILNIIPKEKIYGLLGNHDEWELYSNYNLPLLDDNPIVINNVKIVGLSGSFKYKNNENYALYTHEESIKKAEKAQKADILFTHDRAYIKDNGDDTHDGLKGITYYLYKNHVPLHIHGHLHDNFEETLKNGTRSICTYKYHIFEL